MLLENCPSEPLGKYLRTAAGVRNRMIGKQSSEPVPLMDKEDD